MFKIVKLINKNNNNLLKLKNIVILITKKKFGEGSEILGELLIKNFLIVLNEKKQINIVEIIFLNEGIFLLTKEDFISILNNLKKKFKNLKIFSCGTCVDFYNLKNIIKIADLTNMYHIVEILLKNDIKTIII